MIFVCVSNLKSKHKTESKMLFTFNGSRSFIQMIFIFHFDEQITAWNRWNRQTLFFISHHSLSSVIRTNICISFCILCVSASSFDLFVELINREPCWWPNYGRILVKKMSTLWKHESMLSLMNDESEESCDAQFYARYSIWTGSIIISIKKHNENISYIQMFSFQTLFSFMARPQSYFSYYSNSKHFCEWNKVCSHFIQI